jgi:3-hydroxyisobutyrate dehydrogenase-like beta-hydroxyacid dehydrogenase
VYSPCAASRQKLVSRGATEAPSVAECAREADLTFACVTDDAALHEVAFGANGALANAKHGAIFVDTSTVSPSVSAKVCEEANRRGIAYLRIPISGYAVSAAKGEVTALISGPQDAWQRARPIV